MLADLMGREVRFVPSFLQNAKDGDKPRFDTTPFRGVVTYVHEEHGWFLVTYRSGGNELRECFHKSAIGKEVKVLG